MPLLTANCTRILFIADPQLLGLTYDKSLYSHLARVDADRYLRKTFQHAVEHAQPHIICFLGDLLDEGNIASPDEFQRYTQRFHSIYKTMQNVRVSATRSSEKQSLFSMLSINSLNFFPHNNSWCMCRATMT